MLKREMEELLLDLSDPRIENVVKRAMEEKYQLIFGIYKRFVPREELHKYMLPRDSKKISIILQICYRALRALIKDEVGFGGRVRLR